MKYYTPDQLHTDRTEPVIVYAGAQEWTPSPQPGVERRFLERLGGEVALATSIVRYASGSSFPEHVHPKGEECLVLDGVFSDEQGHFAAGTYVRNPPGSRHAPFTEAGCTIFVKLCQMQDDEINVTVCSADAEVLLPTSVVGLSLKPLYRRHGVEVVNIEQLEPETLWCNRTDQGGEEILVLDGTLVYGATICPPLTWLRVPAGREEPISTTRGCRYWVKRGHLNG